MLLMAISGGKFTDFDVMRVRFLEKRFQGESQAADKTKNSAFPKIFEI